LPAVRLEPKLFPTKKTPAPAAGQNPGFRIWQKQAASDLENYLSAEAMPRTFCSTF
jgi:hypothetical protein